ncbi:Ferripyoverdine receptor [Pandoraea communis]|uniref:Ferripyoverdine receptor n=1 Tax=Pandoraea communis TaxID=2508297 RepID=A0A5E4YL08_9BURK|nr:Ferripyoverdine receptor [Pandoraea communis]
MRLYLPGLRRCGGLLLVLSVGTTPARSATVDAFAGADGEPGRSAVQQTPKSGAEPKSFFFDIPAQPLADALQRYAMISGRPALFSSAQVAGLTSSPVHGELPADTALERLLTGSGLTVQRARTGPAEAFVLKASTTESPSPSYDAPTTAYAGRVQAGVWAALCANTLTRPGQYRTLLRFEIDATGTLRQARLLTSTGERRRDAAVEGIRRRL